MSQANRLQPFHLPKLVGQDWVKRVSVDQEESRKGLMELPSGRNPLDGQKDPIDELLVESELERYK